MGASLLASHSFHMTKTYHTDVPYWSIRAWIVLHARRCSRSCHSDQTLPFAVCKKCNTLAVLTCHAYVKAGLLSHTYKACWPHKLRYINSAHLLFRYSWLQYTSGIFRLGGNWPWGTNSDWGQLLWFLSIFFTRFTRSNSSLDNNQNPSYWPCPTMAYGALGTCSQSSGSEASRNTSTSG